MARSIFENRRPRYQLIAEQLIHDIENEIYPVGDLLPSESQLCAEFGVSRYTVRSAIRELTERGLISAKPGIGTRVMSQSLDNYSQTLKDITDLTGYVKDTVRVVVERASVKASEAEISLPGQPDANWEMFEAVRQTVEGNVTIAWTQVYVIAPYGSALDDVDENGLVYSVIKDSFRIQASELLQTVKALACPPFVAEYLNIEIGSPVLSILRTYSAEQLGAFEVSWSLHPADRFEHTMALKLSG